ncbi:MAG: XdhC/CoxI family protein [Treponema sp.]|jgi:xanthine dehydrogenase accessory factor|nr:XdhC/CoxI family protein [Treponema sp.]
MLDVISFAARNATEGKKVALVTVTETTGSSPASTGQMIAVLADGSTAGTVGGGASEYQIIQKALEAIKNGERIFKFSFDHSEFGMICGGSMAGFGNVLGGGPGLCVFGGGHIAQCLARLATQSGFYVTVVEDRPEFAPDFETARYVLCKSEEYEKNDPASNSDYAVVCTRGHKTDGDALRYCLTKKFEYLGMIGSEKKVTALFDTLRAEGVEQKELDRVYAPIGLDIADSAPAEIAVAILAEILLVKNKGKLRHKKAPRG